MTINLLEVTIPGLIYICLGGFMVTFSMLSLLLKERFYINEVVFATIFGIIIGPHAANIVDPRLLGPDYIIFVTREVTRIVLAIGLFAIGAKLPKSYMAKHARSLLIMVVPTMAIGWIIVAAVIYGLFPRLSFFSCLAIAACLTPTDPVICASIIGGKFAQKHVPLDLRQMLSAESAANDGLAFPFLKISLYLVLDKTRGEALVHWVLVGWLYQVIMGVVFGAIVGWAFSYLMKFSYRRGYIGRESYMVQYLSLSIFIAGFVSTIGSDDLLATFAAGSTISWNGEFKDYTEDEIFMSIIDLVLNCSCFVYLGAWLPFESFNNPEHGITPWRLSILLMSILILRRIPAIMALYRWIPEITTRHEALFSGHFGPMGVGAIFISSLALLKLPTAHYPPQNEQELLTTFLEPIVAFVVLGSIVIHGLSIAFFSLGKNARTLTTTITNTTPDWIVRMIRYCSTITSVGSAPGQERERPAIAEVDTRASENQMSLRNSPSTSAVGVQEVEMAHLPSTR